MYTEQRPKGLPLTENERNLIAYLLKKGYNQTAIAKELGVWPSTICREIKRGQVEQLNGSTWEYYTIYSPPKGTGPRRVYANSPRPRSEDFKPV